MFIQYFDIRIFSLLYLSLSSGLTFILIVQSLGVWLLDLNYKANVISTFTWVTIFYNFKFLLGDLVIRLFNKSIKVATTRRNILMLVQLSMVITMVVLAFSQSLTQMFIFASFLGLFGAINDIILESLRVDGFLYKTTNLASTVSIIGYRIGMFMGSTLSIYLSKYYSWSYIYCLFALILLLCPLFSFLLTQEMYIIKPKAKLVNIIRLCVQNRLVLFYIGIFMLFFKTIDITLHSTLMPVLYEIGYNKDAILLYCKIPSFVAIFTGTVIASFALKYFGVIKCLSITLVFQAALALGSSMHIYLGEQNFVLAGLAFALYSVSGFSQVITLYLLTMFSKGPHSILLFAVITSLSSLARNMITFAIGQTTNVLDFANIYLLVIASLVPGFYLLYKFILPNYNIIKSKVLSENL